MKYFIALAVMAITLSGAANAAEIRMFCKGGADCPERVESALDKIGCVPNLQTLRCQPSSHEVGQEFCEVATEKCSEPRAGNFGGKKCYASDMVSLTQFDRGLTLTWWLGRGPYVKDVCVSN